MREFDVLDKTRWQDLTPATSVGTGSNEAEKWDSEVIIQLGNARRLRIPVQKVAVTVEWPPNWAALKAELSSTWGTKEAEDFSQEDEDDKRLKLKASGTASFEMKAEVLIIVDPNLNWIRI